MGHSYQVEAARESTNLAALLPEWRAYCRDRGNGLLYRDPDWLLQVYREGDPKCKRKDLWVFFLRRRGELVGVFPLVLVDYPFELVLGELTLAKLPCNRLLLPFSDANLPHEDAALDAVFGSVFEQGSAFELIALEDLRVGSFVWSYLHRSPLVRDRFRCYLPGPPEGHSIVRLEGSFADYLAKFSAKTRSKLKWAVRNLEKKRGAIELVRASRPEEVDPFVDAAAEVSRRSYQYNLLGAGIRDPGGHKRHLRFIAEHGWLRSYLLRCDGKPCTFLIGYQDDEVFYYIDVAYDRDWASFSVGKVLQYLVLEDLFADNTPKRYDFCGGHGEQKVFFQNDSYLQSDAWIFPRRPYPRLLEEAHRATSGIHKGIAALLERYELKDRIKRLMRRASVAVRGRQG